MPRPFHDQKLSLHAGAAQLTINPSIGTHIGPPGMKRSARLLLDSLYVRALVLSFGSVTCCLLTFDVRCINDEWANQIRERIAAHFNLERDAVLVHATQSHAAPSMGHQLILQDSSYIPAEHSWLRGSDEAYAPYAAERGLLAVEQARSGMRPVRVLAGSGLEDRVGYNRRVVLRDGSVESRIHRASSAHISHIEGPIDPEVGVLSLVNMDGEPVAHLLHHTCHAFHGLGQQWVTAGWPGVWAEKVRQRFDGVSLVLKGCCGNIHHRNQLETDPKQGRDYVRLGEMLSETTADVLQHQMQPQEPALAWTVRRLALPFREIEEDRLAAARQLLQSQPQPAWQTADESDVRRDWLAAVGLLDLASQQAASSTLPFEIQVLRLGGVAIVGLSGQPFVETQLQIKIASPAYRTFVAHMSNGWSGVVPTPQLFSEDLTKGRLEFLYRLDAGAMAHIVNAARTSVKELFP